MPSVADLLKLSPRAAAQPTALSSDSSSLVDSLKQIGGMGLGAVATVGNFLDLPGSSVRDLLGGENPLDQWSTPFSSDNRLSGRDLLSRWGVTPANKETGITGWASDPAEAGYDLAGFAAEVLTDPFGPLTGSVGQAGKAGARAAAISKAAGRVHPVMGAAFDVGKKVFDTLPGKLTEKILSPVSAGYRAGKSLFNKFAQGVTDPFVQPMAEQVRKNFRQLTDNVQQSTALMLDTAQRTGFNMVADHTLDMTDPKNWGHDASPLRVGARMDAIRNFLEAKDLDSIDSVSPVLQAGDIVEYGGKTHEVEWTDQTMTGRQVKLVGSDDLLDEAAIKPVLMRMGEKIPDELVAPLKRVRSDLVAARQEALDLGINLPEWFDSYVNFAPRAKSDILRQTESYMEKAMIGWRKGFQSLASTLKNPGHRDQMYSAFKEGTPGINRLHNDPKFDKIIDTVEADANPVPILDDFGMKQNVLDKHVGPRHLEEFADLLGTDVDSLWDQINTFLGNPQNPRAFLTQMNDQGMAGIFHRDSQSIAGSLKAEYFKQGGDSVARLKEVGLLPQFRGNRLLDDIMPALDRQMTQQGVNRLEVETSRELADKVWKRYGFEAEGLTPSGAEKWVKRLRPVEQGVTAQQMFHRYLPINDVKRALGAIREAEEQAVKAGEKAGVQPGVGWWNKFAEVGTETDVTKALRMVETDLGRVPTSFDGSPMTRLGEDSIGSLPINMRDAVRDLLDRGEAVYIGKLVKTKGKMAETVLMTPFRQSEIGLKFDNLSNRLDKALKEAPLMHKEASQEEFWAHIRRNYADRVDQWMPELGDRGIVAATPTEELVANMSVNAFQRTYKSLVEKAQEAEMPGVFKVSKQDQALLRLDDRSLNALGFDDSAMSAIKKVRDEINEHTLVGQNYDNVVRQDAAIPVVDRWRALAADLITNQERRRVALFGNNPLIDAADYLSKNGMMNQYVRGVMDFLTNHKEMTKKEVSTLSGNALKSDSAQGGVQLAQLLEPGNPSNIFGGGERIVVSKFLENLRQQWVKAGLLKDVTDAADIAKQINEVKSLRVGAETAQQLRTFNEMPFGTAMPEVEGMARSISNATMMFKNYALMSPATGFRDALSSMFNAVIMGDMNPVSIFRKGRQALSFARTGRLDLGQGVKEIDDLLKRYGMENNSANREAALASIWAAHHRAPSRHANVEFADPSAILQSGQADQVLNQFPGFDSGIFSRAGEILKGTPEYLKTMATNPAKAFGQGIEAFKNVPGTWTTEPRFQRPVQRSQGNIMTDIQNQYRGLMDGTVRMSFVLDQLEKGKGLADALQEADRVLTNADPRNFTRFERTYLKTVIPFYSFMRQTVPLFLRELAVNPGGKLGQTIRATRLAQGDEKGYVPFQYQDTTAIPIGSAADGTMKYLTSLGLMHEDAVAYAGNILQGDFRGVGAKLLGSGNPAVKWAMEYITNTSLFSQGPMGARRLDDLDPTLGRILTNVGLQDVNPSGRATPVGGAIVESALAASPISRQLSMLKIVTAPSERSSAIEKVARLLGGMKVETVTPEQTVREIRDRLNALQIETGARPLTIVSGTSKLQERLREVGQGEQADKLKQVDDLLKLLKKQVEGEAAGPTRKKERKATADMIRRLSAS